MLVPETELGRFAAHAGDLGATVTGSQRCSRCPRATGREGVLQQW